MLRPGTEGKPYTTVGHFFHAVLPVLYLAGGLEEACHAIRTIPLSGFFEQVSFMDGQQK